MRQRGGEVFAHLCAARACVNPRVIKERVARTKQQEMPPAPPLLDGVCIGALVYHLYVLRVYRLRPEAYNRIRGKIIVSLRIAVSFPVRRCRLTSG